MSRLFISHSSHNDDWALALRDWMVREGWSGENDIFLDLDPERGIVAGQRWVRALEDAATRCEAVLFLVSEDWLASKWCGDEYHLASKLNKKLFALLIDTIALDRLPGGLAAQWQVISLKGEPAERFLVTVPRTQTPSSVLIAEAGLRSLKRGLERAGIGPDTFELQPDANDPTGWRAPYRGLEALEPEDAAVFFGRHADIVRGIDALRGLAVRKPPRLLVILGASGAGKSSFLRAGLWPRLLRDDSQWLPLKTIRAGRGGAVEGSEGLLASLEDVHRRFALRTGRANLRERIAAPGPFLELLGELRQAAARRMLLTEPPYPLPVLCLDQGEELFAADAGPESEKFLALARAAIDADAALLLVAIRSDAYALMQGATALAGIDQVPLSLGPVPHGELARIVREPSEVLRRKAGPSAPVFDAAVVERLQAEVAGEADALPLLAFVLQRLMREHASAGTIGLAELARTGGVAAAIEAAAETALADAGYGADRSIRRDVLRRLFIPRLARIDRETKAAQRRVARQSDLPADLAALAHALTERRLLVVKLANEEAHGAESGAATLEVAHEALLRHWPTLADLLAQDREALILLDGVLLAANDWDKADAARKEDFLAHRGLRLADAQALAARGPDWAREIAPARNYLAACRRTEQGARAIRRRVQALVGALVVIIVAGLMTWWQGPRLNMLFYWAVHANALSAAQERALMPGAGFKECTHCPEMVVIPAGSFTMGSSEAKITPTTKTEHPSRQVTIGRKFAVARHELTFVEWEQCVAHGECDQPGSEGTWGRGKQPVIKVSWSDARRYVAWLGKITGRPYRLLSEAEWEYAARANSTTHFFFSNDPQRLPEYAWYADNAERQTHTVGEKRANPFGLHDIYGNVAEWVEDCFQDSYKAAPTDGSARTSGSCIRRVVRGGSWDNQAPRLRSSARDWRRFDNREDATVGIRVGRTLGP